VNSRSRDDTLNPNAVHGALQISMERLKTEQSVFLSSARIAHLATANSEGQPHVVPICFVFDGKRLYSPIDEKPKKVAAKNLKRLENIRQNPRVSLVIDHYEEDWRKLAYILLVGRARIRTRGENHRRAVRLLRRKYRQYRQMRIAQRPVIEIRIVRWSYWAASNFS
jgi:coenzyme F420-0:L-glutamate ligase / coenzyme F420-1:gamma-L-glutamate ligase